MKTTPTISKEGRLTGITTPEEFLKNIIQSPLTFNAFDSVQQYDIPELMESFAKERAVEFAFDELGHNDYPNSNVCQALKEQLKAHYDEFINNESQ